METLGAGSGSADAEGTANTSGSAIVGLSLHSALRGGDLRAR